MNFEIKNRFSGNIIFSLECETLKFCTVAAIRSGANLCGADLCGADLSGADLGGADLSDADLSGADLCAANLYRADLRGAYLKRAYLCDAYLSRSDLYGADLRGAELSRAYLSGACLCRADLRGAELSDANLSGADLRGAELSRANLYGANLSDADLSGACLCGAELSRANLYGANLSGAKNMVKLMGVEPGNFYWKRFEIGLNNNGYQFHVGLNTLRDGESFADDEREMCSFPGFYFASRSWCAVHYSGRPLEAKIRIPEGAQINEPWATDGKASADTIEIMQVFDVKTGKDVTDEYKR